MRYGAERIGEHWVVKYPGLQPFYHGPFKDEATARDFARKENTFYEEARSALAVAMEIEFRIDKDYFL